MYLQQHPRSSPSSLLFIFLPCVISLELRIEEKERRLFLSIFKGRNKRAVKWPGAARQVPEKQQDFFNLHSPRHTIMLPPRDNAAAAVVDIAAAAAE